MEQKINVHWSWFTRIVTILVSLVFARIIWEEFKDFQANSLNRGVLYPHFCSICDQCSYFGKTDSAIF